MLGTTQEKWLRSRAAQSTARWDVLGQQVFFGDLWRPLPDGRLALPMDSWNGYVAARDRVIDIFAARARNFVVLTGDVHRHYAGSLTAAAGDRAPVGVEFVTTSITSGGDGSDNAEQIDPILRANPNLCFTCDRRGYLVAEVTSQAWTTHYRVVPYVTRPGAPVETRCSYVMAAGEPGLSQV